MPLPPLDLSHRWIQPQVESCCSQLPQSPEGRDKGPGDTSFSRNVGRYRPPLAPPSTFRPSDHNQSVPPSTTYRSGQSLLTAVVGNAVARALKSALHHPRSRARLCLFVSCSRPGRAIPLADRVRHPLDPDSSRRTPHILQTGAPRIFWGSRTPPGLVQHLLAEPNRSGPVQSIISTENNLKAFPVVRLFLKFKDKKKIY